VTRVLDHLRYPRSTAFALVGVVASAVVRAVLR
jgi:hypothetical protein